MMIFIVRRYKATNIIFISLCIIIYVGLMLDFMNIKSGNLIKNVNYNVCTYVFDNIFID